MARKRFTPEEIIGKLRQAEVMLSQGMKTAEVCKVVGCSAIAKSLPHAAIPAT
jgi:putative transposase